MPSEDPPSGYSWIMSESRTGIQSWFAGRYVQSTSGSGMFGATQVERPPVVVQPALPKAETQPPTGGMFGCNPCQAAATSTDPPGFGSNTSALFGAISMNPCQAAVALPSTSTCSPSSYGATKPGIAYNPALAAAFRP